MPELDAGSRDENIMRSVDAFVREHIQIGLGKPVYYQYQYVPSSIQLPEEWVVVTLMPLGPVRTPGQADSDSYATWTEASIDINIFQQSDAVGLAEVNRYSLVSLARQIKDIFQIGTAIPIYDYGTVGEPQVFSLRVEEEPRRQVVSTPDENAIRQANVIVPLRYFSIVANAYD